MVLRDILFHKGTRVVTCSPEATLGEVIETLVAENIGSLVVCDGDRLIGIITERDILRATAADRTTYADRRVAECMTGSPILGSPDDAIADVMGTMTTHRIRHLPVLENERLVGLVSIGDIVKAQHDALTQENHYLKTYLYS